MGFAIRLDMSLIWEPHGSHMGTRQDWAHICPHSPTEYTLLKIIKGTLTFSEVFGSEV